ncbi:MAG: hypothetical protein FWC92_08865 [Defluviitaleaceae bacterium]|nr:hypothetical protein [Defluviitaleaceae bacterium]
MNSFYQESTPKTQRPPQKWVERIVIIVGIIVAIPAVVLFVIGFVEGVDDVYPVTIRTYAELKEFTYPSQPVGRVIRFYTPLEPVGYLSSAFGGFVSHNFYIGELEDTFIIIMVATPAQVTVYLERTAVLAEVEGRLSSPQNSLNFRMMRDRLTSIWEMTLDEFDEMFTPYFVSAQWRGVNMLPVFPIKPAVRYSLCQVHGANCIFAGKVCNCAGNF